MVSARASSPSGGDHAGSLVELLDQRTARLVTAQLHEAVPMDPPAITARDRRRCRPIRTVTRSIGTPSASAATWVSAVRAPVPMSAAAISTTNLPSGSA